MKPIPSPIHAYLLFFSTNSANAQIDNDNMGAMIKMIPARNP